MSEVKKRGDIAKELAESLKNDLKVEKITLRKFADEFYKEKVDPDASSVEG